MRPGPVVVGVSGSDSSLDALDEAAALACELGRLLVVAHVRRVAMRWEPLVAMATEVWLEAETEATSDCLTMCELALTASPVSWRYEARDGDPADELLVLARLRDAAVVVIGSGRHWRVAEVGSVGARVVHAADGPVLVVPARR